MIRLLSLFFIKPDMDEERKRTTLGMLCGGVGIFLNLLLFAGKATAGLLSGAISIFADAFNNLSDAGASIINLLGFKLSGQRADRDHPYGHGRFEYITGLMISALILIMGFELFKESFKKLFHPEEVVFSATVLAILIASILVKCYMAFYNFTVGRKINSVSVMATAKDSLSDCIVTATVLLATLVEHFWGLQLDGWAGLIVSGLIFYAGFSAGKDAIDPLLGTAPDEEYIKEIERIVVGFDESIVGIHDLMIHDYGPGRKIISLHAEVPSDGNIMEMHDIVDNLEKKLTEDLNCVATIHMDPISVGDERTEALREKTRALLCEINPEMTVHDFRTVIGDTHTNLIFDVAVPFSCKLTDAQVITRVKELVREKIGEEYAAVIQLDRGGQINR